MSDAAPALDIYSTSPTKEGLCSSFQAQKRFSRCQNGAPFFGYRVDGARWAVVQGCCNKWTCEKCGEQVAKQHYGRIVEGARALAKDRDMYFITVTCKGRKLSLSDAMAGYLEWTNRLLDACRLKAKRASQEWAYVQVTEQQGRGHPHSHILSLWAPDDVKEGKHWRWMIDNAGNRVREYYSCWRSAWFEQQLERSGLGSEYDIQTVRTIEGAARYVAKYLFKPDMFKATFPKNWKRVRYSDSWPKLPEEKTDAIALLSRDDWQRLTAKAATVTAKDPAAYDEAVHFLKETDTLVVPSEAVSEYWRSLTTRF